MRVWPSHVHIYTARLCQVKYNYNIELKTVYVLRLGPVVHFTLKSLLSFVYIPYKGSGSTSGTSQHITLVRLF